MMQFLAVKLPQNFKRLYFTTRFFTFEPLKTVAAQVTRKEASDKDDDAAVPLHVEPSVSTHGRHLWVRVWLSIDFCLACGHVLCVLTAGGLAGFDEPDGHGDLPPLQGRHGRGSGGRQ